MAEFKLGRIRFVWKGDWTTATTYYKDDVIRYGGRTYICAVGHTAAASFDTDLTYSPTKWNQMSDGLDWKGDWTTATVYKVRDIVKYGGNLYVAAAGHTAASAFETDLTASRWDLFAEGFDWKGNWTTATSYKIGDIVRYGGNTYRAKATHTSGTFSSDLSANWEVFNTGIEYKGTWATATAYKVNDVVLSGGGLWITAQDHTSDATSFENDQSTYWTQFVKGFEYEGDWSGATSYQPGDIVKYGGNQYIAKTTHTNSTPTPGSDWDLFTEGFNFVSDWSGVTAYKVGDVVRLNGYTYLATATSTNQEPPNASYWERLNAGISWQGEWQNSTDYKLGDAVVYNGNSYIVVQAHTSADDDSTTLGDVGRSPATDTTGTYYNVLALGSEVAVLTTTGDLVYYGGNGPTRLPVGTEGQILTAGATYPEWATLGDVDHVYYVSPTGEDRPYPLSGYSIDKPWKTIRYAAEQVEKGPRNPGAQRLLELNRVFLQREVTAYIDYQVNYFTNTAPDVSSIWYNFDYDEYKCERDVGFIVDALIYDLGHGGNVKSRGAANSYVQALYESEREPYLNLSAEKEQDIESFTHMLTVVQAVLNQEAPGTVYQNVSDDSTAIAAQVFDSDVTAESGTYTTVASLVEIITNALEDEDASRVPARYSPSNLIKIATGTYREVLPIIVPEQTCILGDELRSTNIRPAAVSDRNLDITDAKYSIGSLGRMETILPLIAQGSTVTPTSGNSETQSKVWPYSDNDTGESIARLARSTAHNIDWRLGSTALRSIPDATGYNSSFLSGYGDARKNILYNKKFFAEQVKKFIDTNYSSVKYSRTKCLQDVGYIVDAMVYDLTYGGYSESLNAGLAYFDGPGGALAFDSTEKTATLASYNYLKGMMSTAALANTVTSNQSVIAQFKDTAGSAGSATFIEDNMDIIYNIINGGTTSAPTVRITTIATNTCTTSANHGLGVGDAITIIDAGNGLTEGVKYWIKTVPAANQFTLSATYDGTTATLTNGTSLTLDAYAIDYPSAADASVSGTFTAAFAALDGQQETLVSAATSFISATYPSLSYNVAKCERDTRLILEAIGFDAMFNSNWKTVKAAHAYLRSTASDVYDGGQKAATIATYNNVKSTIAGDTATYVNGDSTYAARVEALFETLEAIIFSGSIDGSICQTNDRMRDYAVLQIERNRDFIKAEVDAWIASTYTDTVTATSGSGNIVTISDTSWLQRNTAIRFSGSVGGGLATGTTYYVQNVESSTTFTVALTRNATTAITLTNYTTSFTVDLYYDSTLCQRDVDRYIDAFKYDTRFVGNYKSIYAGRYYANAVTGSLEEDMFYLRDATGLRDCTLQGLTGDLLAVNSNGTSRVSAGAYASLDPGWGPDDYRVWIIDRSPYIQGVTTIGTACIGQKIDGALHNGGNDSMVSNDFTQVLSDGIGAWVDNNGRAELVSVFTYYNHIGYLSTNGGRIRGTNGNNSYGDFGSVAEGFDATETPNTAVVDNIFQFKATAGSVLTNNSSILQFEYDHAGQDYTEAAWTITGGGINADVDQDEFRDGAVSQVRLLDLGDDSSGQLGGDGFLTVTGGVSGGGTTTTLQLTATDDQLTNGYAGMRITITTGTGQGQYGIIQSNDAATKTANIIRESDGQAGFDTIIPGTTVVAPDASSIYTIEPAISFTAPPTSSTTGAMHTSATWTRAVYGETVGVYTPAYTYSGSGTGAIFTVTRNGWKYDVTITSGGTGYTRLETITIAGNNLGGTTTENDLVLTITSVDSNGVIQAFDQTGSGKGGVYIAVTNSGTTSSISSDGSNWSAGGSLPSSGNWTGITHGLIDDGSTIAKVSRFVAVQSGADIAAYSDDGGATWTQTALPASANWSSVVYGNGKYVAIASNSTTTAVSNDGVIWDQNGTLQSTGFVDIAYGAGYYVAVKPSASTGAINRSLDGVSWTAEDLNASHTWNSIAYGDNAFVVVATDSNAGEVSGDAGANWTATTMGSPDSTDPAGYQQVRYGQGVFIATTYLASVTGYSTVMKSENGIYWEAVDLPSPGTFSGYNAVAFGNPNRVGHWAIISYASGTHVANLKTGAKARARSFVSTEKIFAIRLTEPGSGYVTAPTMTVTDPGNTYDPPHTVRISDGALGQPSFVNRGVQYTTGSAAIGDGDGDGYADIFQDGAYVAVRRITNVPVAGSNVVFDHIPDRTFKLVSILTLRGSYDGAYTAFYQVSPEILSTEAADHLTGVETRIRYSQVRLTGHDFLDVGTGNLAETNYPGTPTQDPVQANETYEADGGRVFYASTDQDGNFRVGDLFSVEQSTGVATLNADAFNISGLQEISLGEVTLGGGSATITEFSTDPFFTADSDSVIPTQRAIKAYIASQIGGGGAALNVGSVTAGNIFVSGNTITTVGGATTITMNAKFNFTGGITGYPLAMNYFLV